MKLKMGFVKRDGKNAIGVRYELDKKTTVKSVHELRKFYADLGPEWKETPRTRKYTDREVARMAKALPR